MRQFSVTGMSCAACSARVEKAVSAVDGVDVCSVNLLTGTMGIEGTASDSEIINAVVNAGYGASVKGSTAVCDDDMLKDRETPQMVKRLCASLIFLLVLLYFSMGHSMLDLPLPSVIGENQVMQGIIQLVLAAAVMVINQKFFINGFKGIARRSPNMDTLVAMSSGAAFVYSLFSLLAMTNDLAKGNISAVSEHDLYFEAAAMILTLITVGKLLESRSKGRTTDALKGLMKLAPEKAVVILDGKETEIPAENVKSGDIFVVRAGETVPVDGEIISGEAALNESALTGESIPADKKVGDKVSAASISQSGYIMCRATRVGSDTTLSKIIQMVSEASATKAPIAKTADRVSAVFVPTVIGIAAVTFIVWLILGKSMGFAVSRAISVLVISCPCALGLATPVAVMAGSGTGARNGILFKTAASLEFAGKISTVVLDKTGTITKGEPEVTDVIPAESSAENELLKTACSLERKSEHPLAGAIVKFCETKGIGFDETEDYKTFTGNGICGKIGSKNVCGGSLKYISEIAEIPEDALKTAEKLSDEGKTPVFFAENRKYAGIIAVADVIREESRQAVRELKNMGLRVVMLTGDNSRTANAIGKLAGVDEVIAEVLPDGKENEIRRLKKCGRTAMVGDGINDAPALASADIGIAIGKGSDIAVDSADIVLMKSRLTDVPAAVRLSRKTLKNIKENLFWAFFYNIIGIPLAAGVYIGLFGWKLNPVFGAAAMSLSSFCVVTNALRLNFFNVYDSKHDVKVAEVKSESFGNSTKTVYIKGMMCSHCEARVKKVLEETEGIDEAVVSHEKGTAVISVSGNIQDKDIKKIINDAGYKFIRTE